MALTPEERKARDAFQAAVRQALRDRAALMAGTEKDVLARLRDAAAQIAQMLAAQPSDWRVWQLNEIQAQVQALIDGMTGQVTATLDAGLAGGWQTGVDAVDKPLAAADLHITWRLPILNTSVLTSLRSFSAGRIKDLGAEAAGAIDRSIGLTVLGAQTPWDAIQQVQAQLGSKDAASLQRAQTIVRTQMGEAFALGQQARLEQSALHLPGLQKQWRRSGKIQSRWNHDAIDGQVVDAGQPFELPSKNGVVKMMHPHDPAAPAAEIINCGCTARPWMARWGLPPGGTAFSDREIALNPMKAASARWKSGG